MDPEAPDYDAEVDYADQEVDEEIEQWEEELAQEELKPEPMSFADEYTPAPAKPVELVVPRHSDAFNVMKDVKERRFPAKRVARSAASLARALKAAGMK